MRSIVNDSDLVANVAAISEHHIVVAERLLLTHQQRRVLVLLCQGRTNKQIAESLGLKEPTVKTHVSGVLRRLGVKSRTQAVLLCQHGARRKGSQEMPLRAVGRPCGESGGLSRRLLLLTERELQVLQMVRQGLFNKQIAFALGVCQATVKAHVGEILRKLGVTTRTQIVIEVSKLNSGALGAPPLELRSAAG